MIRAVEMADKGILLVVLALGMLFAVKGDFFLICDSRYNHYVELLEPAGPRACIRCCDDPADCPTNMGKLPQGRLLFVLFFEWRFFRYRWLSCGYPGKLL